MPKKILVRVKPFGCAAREIVNVITDLRTAEELSKAYEIVYGRDSEIPRDSLRYEESIRKIKEFTGGTYFVNIEFVFLENLRVDISIPSREG